MPLYRVRLTTAVTLAVFTYARNSVEKSAVSWTNESSPSVPLYRLWIKQR